MNKRPAASRSLILRCLMDGMSVAATCRVTGAAKRTVLNLLVEAGEFCEVWSGFRFRNLAITEVQVDEQWGFIGSKARNAKVAGHGDIWVFAGMDAKSKLLFSWLVGGRTPENTRAFIRDLSGRVSGRIQLTSDGWHQYPNAVRGAFDFAKCDYAMLQKTYGQASEEALTTRRYSPPVCTGAKKIRMIGRPKMDKVSTSYIERVNLNTRMNCRRMTRLSNGFSRKHQNHAAALALTFWSYNYCKVNRTLTKAAKGIHQTPAIAAGLSDHVWTADDLVAMMDGTQNVG